MKNNDENVMAISFENILHFSICVICIFLHELLNEIGV